MNEPDKEQEIGKHIRALHYFENLINSLREQGTPLDDPVFRDITYFMWKRLQNWELLEFETCRFHHSSENNIRWN